MDVFDSNGVGRITGEQLSLQRLSVVEWELPAGEEEVEAGGIVVSSPETLSGFLRFRHKDGENGHLRRGIPGGGVFQALCERWKNNCEHLPVLLQNYLFFHGLHSAAVSAACL